MTIRQSRLPVFALALALAGCGGGSTTTESVTPVTTEAPIETSPSTTSAVVVPDTTVAVETATTPKPTEPPPAPNSSPATSVGSDPATTEPVYVQELLLSDRGLGIKDFGAPPDEVIQYVSSMLGATTADSDWVEASQFPDCAGTQVRVVDWGVLSLQFADTTKYGSEQHFSGWTYGNPVEIGEEPVGLHTDAGLSVGSSVAQLKAGYPDAEFQDGDPESAYPDSFYLGDDLWGLLSGTRDSDSVTVLYGGLGCGG